MFILFFERKSDGLKGSLVSRKEKRVLLAKRVNLQVDEIEKELIEVQKQPQKCLDTVRRKMKSEEELAVRLQR